jgi:hypothetical protein
VLFLVKLSQALLNWPRTGLDVEGVLGDFLGDVWNFYQAPHKSVLVASEEVNELAFLFGIQIGTNPHGFDMVFSLDLHGLGIVGCLKNIRRWGYGGAKQRCGHSEANLP